MDISSQILALNRTEKILYGTILLFNLTGLLLVFFYPDQFENFVREDGIVETCTALLLFFTSLLLLEHLLSGKIKYAPIKALVTFVLAVVFIFGAGEEISWGQRIFHFSSGEFFMENNTQGETNLHNLMVHGFKINKLIFGQLLTVLLVIHLFLTPYLYAKLQGFRELANQLAIPIGKYHHALYFTVVLILIFIIPSGKKWELFELSFSSILFLIFLFPVNKFFIQIGPDKPLMKRKLGQAIPCQKRTSTREQTNARFFHKSH